MLDNGVQSFIKTVGDEGCYALTLCKVAEIELKYFSDAGTVVRDIITSGVETGYIKNDMTVLDGEGFLKKITRGVKWTKEYKEAGYAPQKGDYLIAEWFNKRTGLTHFTLEYPVKWDGLKDSVTVREGSIRSYRLYRESK
jgi:hypothetical protein